MPYMYFVDSRYVCGVRDHQRAVRRFGDGVFAGRSGSVEEHDELSHFTPHVISVAY